MTGLDWMGLGGDAVLQGQVKNTDIDGKTETKSTICSVKGKLQQALCAKADHLLRCSGTISSIGSINHRAVDSMLNFWKSSCETSIKFNKSLSTQ